MSTARERVQQEAARRFPNPAPDPGVEYPPAALRQFQRGGFIAGRTVTAEQIEQAAEAYLGTIVWMDEGDWQNADQQTQDAARAEARKVFAAAGFIVEEEA